MNHDLHRMLNKISSQISGSEQLMVPYLVVKAQASLKEMPHDKTLGQLAFVLSQMVDNNKTFISRANFKDLYNKSYQRGTKAGEIFETELLSSPKQASVTYAPKAPVGEVKALSDEFLDTTLQDVFAGGTVREYPARLADEATKAVTKSLNIWGMSPHNVSVNAGNSKALIIKADYDTPKGITSVYIPVDISGGTVVESSMFMGNTDPTELNNINLKNYIKTYAGTKLNISAETLLKTIDAATSTGRTISGAEMALLRLKAKRGASGEFASNCIVGMQLDDLPVPDVQAKKYAETDEFSAKFATTYGQAAGYFGEDKLDLARNAVLRATAGFGYKNPQLRLKSHNASGVTYAVSLGAVAFTVPVKIQDGLVHPPSCIISNGSVHEFSANSISKLHNELHDYKAAAVASPLHDLSSGEIVDIVRTAISEGNLKKAEDSLNILMANEDHVGYAKAFSIYMSGLAPVKSEVKTKCSAMTKSSTSSELVCSHTGLPISKVYQDKHGNCRPHWRQNLDDTSESVISFNAKVFI